MTKRGEFDLIAQLFAPLSIGFEGAFGLTDDAAVLDVPDGFSAVTTTDTIVAGVHFLKDDPPDMIARKLIRVNLSDVAAMGATPWVILLNTCLPRNIDDSWLESFAAGLSADCKLFGLHLVGGDTVATEGPAVLGITAIGLVAQGRAIRRQGAQAGDIIYVSGTIGDAALGLMACRDLLPITDEAIMESLKDRYRLPRPRVGLGPRLSGIASACLDVSDGLCQDLAHLCRASGVGADINVAAVPLSDAARQVLATTPELLQTVLCGGDDYELVFTASPDQNRHLEVAAEAAGVTVTAIGRAVTSESVRVFATNGQEIQLDRTGYQHFRQG